MSVFEDSKSDTQDTQDTQAIDSVDQETLSSDQGIDILGLLRMLAVVGGIAAVFVLAGLTSLLFFIAAIIAIVMVHELGHFATAKWSHMKVTEYFVGFGPRLWSFKRGDTVYGVKPILAGGYVKIPGMTSLEEVDPIDEPHTYRQQPFYKRIIVTSAGSFMHYVMAFLLAWIAVVSFGVPSSSSVQVLSLEKWSGVTQTPAQAAGLRPGDIINSINGKSFSNPAKLHDVLTTSVGKAVRLGIERNGVSSSVTVVPVDGRKIHIGSTTLAPATDKSPQGFIGISEGSVMSSEGPLRALGTAGIDIGRETTGTISGLAKVFSLSGLSSLFHQVASPAAARKAAANPASSDRVMSLVGAARLATQAENAGMLYFIEILIALNIVFALMNMLPMLPLDGGHVAIAVYEWIRTKKGAPYYRADVNKLMPVVYAFITFLGVIVLAAVFLDITHPIGNIFP